MSSGAFSHSARTAHGAPPSFVLSVNTTGGRRGGGGGDLSVEHTEASEESDLVDTASSVLRHSDRRKGRPPVVPEHTERRTDRADV